MNDIAISFTLNGKAQRLAVAPNLVLADLLRERFGLTGCKVGCDEGVCGACTVLIDGVPIAACTRFAFSIDGGAMTTIEGLSRGGELDRVQAAFLAAGALQCGFCTPGMILSVVALLARIADPDEAAIRDWFGGNICRCTGYKSILEAIRLAARAEPVEPAR